MICSALVKNVLRERFSSPTRMLAVALIILYLVYQDAFVLSSGQFPHLDAPWLSSDERSMNFFAYILGFGVIGQDMSSGTIQVILSRPLSRVSYVLSKWTAIFLGSVFFCLFTLLAEHLVSVGQNSALLFDSSVLVAGASRILLCLLSTSTIVCVSSLFPGMRDILALIAVSFVDAFVSFVLFHCGDFSSVSWIPEALMKTMNNAVHFIAYLSAMLGSITDIRLAFIVYGISWTRISLFCLLVSGLVAIAVLSVIKREISYATD